MMIKGLEIVNEIKATLGEGPLWDGKNHLLYWVDIIENKIHIYNPGTGSNKELKVPQHIGALALKRSGEAIVALHKGIYSLDLITEEVELISSPEPNLTTRFNDGKCDVKGRFWAGTMYWNPNCADTGIKSIGSLYCLDIDYHLRTVFGGVTCSNGIGWSPDNSIMYYIDTPTRQVAVFDFDLLTGEISNRRVAVEFSHDGGSPDGMTIDEEGMIWVAQWGGWQVSRWNPFTGEKLQKIEMPVSQVSSCTFGGSDLDELYITTAANELSDEENSRQPYAGHLFMIKPGVKGLPAFEFGR